jgi:hypothetical protein
MFKTSRRFVRRRPAETADFRVYVRSRWWDWPTPDRRLATSMNSATYRTPGRVRAIPNNAVVGTTPDDEPTRRHDQADEG